LTVEVAMTKTSPTILLVDDDERFLELLEKRCLRMGFSAVTAVTGQEGIDAAKKQEFTIAVVDHRLPDMDGLVTITKLKEIHPDLKTVLLTGHGDEKLEKATKSLNSAYFDKSEMGRFWSFLEDLPLKRLRVLLVDDDERFLRTLESRVRLSGYDPLTAGDAATAIRIAESREIHVAVIDQRLPDEDGLVLITKLRALKPEIETILLTAFGSEKLREATKALNSAYSDKGEMKGFWGAFRRILRRLELTMAAAGLAAGGDPEDALRIEHADREEE
jgi:ActR/RegA family two-component response regulator